MPDQKNTIYRKKYWLLWNIFGPFSDKKVREAGRRDGNREYPQTTQEEPPEFVKSIKHSYEQEALAVVGIWRKKISSVKTKLNVEIQQKSKLDHLIDAEKTNLGAQEIKYKDIYGSNPSKHMPKALGPIFYFPLLVALLFADILSVSRAFEPVVAFQAASYFLGMVVSLVMLAIAIMIGNSSKSFFDKDLMEKEVYRDEVGACKIMFFAGLFLSLAINALVGILRFIVLREELSTSEAFVDSFIISGIGVVIIFIAAAMHYMHIHGYPAKLVVKARESVNKLEEKINKSQNEIKHLNGTISSFNEQCVVNVEFIRKEARLKQTVYQDANGRARASEPPSTFGKSIELDVDLRFPE